MINFLKGFWRLHSTTVNAGAATVVRVAAAACIAVVVCIVGWFWVTGFAGLVLDGLPAPAWNDSSSGASIQWNIWVGAHVMTGVGGLASYLLLVIGMTTGRKDVEKAIRDSMIKAVSFYRECRRAGTNQGSKKKNNEDGNSGV